MSATLAFDASADVWTCNQWSDMGIWTSEEYCRELSFNRTHRCGAINPLGPDAKRDFCRRCGSGRHTQEHAKPYVPWSWRRTRQPGPWLRFLPRRRVA